MKPRADRILIISGKNRGKQKKRKQQPHAVPAISQKGSEATDLRPARFHFFATDPGTFEAAGCCSIKSLKENPSNLLTSGSKTFIRFPPVKTAQTLTGLQLVYLYPAT